MAANARPSFLKRQKEQQRTARATEKREARRLRKLSKTDAAESFGTLEIEGETGIETEMLPDETEGGGQTAGKE
jgi:hypothetical protein